ncbi:hypothetical protein [Actinomycetospora chibensis]|uniref:Uncharacterized protein n=1 Tax=Actinomycetospora chibensis TaxID=663606 RepID=A0ABV9RM60_9PSEU|nr:hypothetical protein [Actinomycetospora chibensis]MDD7924932.1 hypothetical protein [Actinomycetospora chibensis]
MAACVSVLVLAGLVAVIAGAVGADRSTASRLAAEDGAGTSESDAPPSPAAATGAEEPTEPTDAPPEPSEPPAEPVAGPGPGRVPDAGTTTTLAVLPGWRVTPTQDVVEVPPGRFEGATILQRGAGTVVLVGLADPERVPARVDPARPDPAQEEALAAEAGRLADAYADLLAPGAETGALTDNDTSIADLPTRTSVRRVEGGALDGALVRVSTLAAPGRTVTVLAVARPAPDIDAEGDAADEVVRSLRLEDPAPAP